MSEDNAQLNREIHALVQRFAGTLPDEVIAGALVSNAFLVNLRHENLDQAVDRIRFSLEALRGMEKS